MGVFPHKEFKTKANVPAACIQILTASLCSLVLLPLAGLGRVFAAPATKGHGAGTPAEPAESGAACLYYSETAEQLLQCGPRGYPLGFGQKYCQRFSKLGPDTLTPRGLRWRDAARSCLIEAFGGFIDEPAQPPGCQEVKRMAFDSHPPCYTEVQPSFCLLPPSDVLAIIRVVEPVDALSPLATRQNIRIASRCLTEWKGRAKEDARAAARVEFWRSVLQIQRNRLDLREED